MKNKYFYILVLIALFISACTTNKNKALPSLKNGIYKVKIITQGIQIPFNLIIDLQNDLKITILNGEEKIELKNAIYKNDSLFIPMSVYDADIIAKVSGDSLIGAYTKNYVEDYTLQFEAIHIDALPNVEQKAKPNFNLENKYRVYFEKNLKDSIATIGKFEQNGIAVSGTFLTNTGDYRFLSGNAYADSFVLAGFDGGFIMRFEAKVLADGSIEGTRWSGKSLKEKWYAYPDSNVKLANPYLLTQVDTQAIFELNAIDLEGNSVTLNDAKFKDKPVLIQIMGTWCPNCLDEAQFLSNWYKVNKNMDLAVIGISFESSVDFEYAKQRIKLFKDNTGIEYDILFGGKTDAESTQKALPLISKIMAYPTMVYLNKNHKVAFIHTGFNGPSTGEYYDNWILDFKQKIEYLTKN